MFRLLTIACVFTFCSTYATRLRIIHTNDLHARFEQTSVLSGKCSDKDAAGKKCYGGFARLATAVAEQRRIAAEEGIPLLYLNAGDSYQGTVWYSLFKWPIVADMMDKLGLDAMSLGNHEFDEGIAGLAPYLRNVSTPVLICNIGVEDEPDLADTPLRSSIIIEKDGLRIGIIGYLTPETKTIAAHTNVKWYKEESRINEEAMKLKAEGVDIIIALGHSGYEVDLQLAKNCPHVDIIVGGHSHSFLYTGKPPSIEQPIGPYPTLVHQTSGRLVPVVQAYAFSKYLGVLDVELNSTGEVIKATGAPILLDSRYAEDQTTLDRLEKWRPGLKNLTKEVLSQTRVLLNGTCRLNECNLANLITDAFVDYAVRNSMDKNWTDAAIGLYNGGGVRATIAPSDRIIRTEDIVMTMPFYNPLTIISLKGKYLLEALEWSVHRYDKNYRVAYGEFLHFSGMKVEYDIDRPVGHRVVKVLVRCRKCSVPTFLPLNLEEDYNIVTNSYIGNGGDSFSAIGNNRKVLTAYELMDTDVVIEYLKRHSQLGDLYNGVEGRIQFVSTRQTSGSSSNIAPHSITIVISSLILLFLRLIY